ncbi:hypothetical protein CSC82_19500 [Rhodobacteraceae bacterium 4F10]|nr:hypothetical protein CSC82_19500 [Rhodobacteraceae bacterium 4F10]
MDQNKILKNPKKLEKLLIYLAKESVLKDIIPRRTTLQEQKLQIQLGYVKTVINKKKQKKKNTPQIFYLLGEKNRKNTYLKN